MGEREGAKESIFFKRPKYTAFPREGTSLGVAVIYKDSHSERETHGVLLPLRLALVSFVIKEKKERLPQSHKLMR